MIDTLVIVAVAAHRFWMMWFTPNSIFQPVRRTLGRMHGLVRYAVNCPMCFSMWSALGVGALWVLGWPWRGLVWALAISELIFVIENLLKVLDRVALLHMTPPPPPPPVQTNGAEHGDVLRRP